MNNITFDHRSTIPNSFGNMTKINPFNQPKNISTLKIASSKRKHYVPNSQREFGKEINISSNLTTLNNQESVNNRKSIAIPIDPKIKKDNKIKKYQKVSIQKRKKESSNSLVKRQKDSNDKIGINKSFKEKVKKDNKITNKTRSQKIFYRTIIQ